MVASIAVGTAHNIRQIAQFPAANDQGVGVRTITGIGRDVFFWYST